MCDRFFNPFFPWPVGVFFFFFFVESTTEVAVAEDWTLWNPPNSSATLPPPGSSSNGIEISAGLAIGIVGAICVIALLMVVLLFGKFKRCGRRKPVPQILNFDPAALRADDSLWL